MESSIEIFIDSTPVSTLLDRYGIKKSMLYVRFNHLGITPEKRGGKAYVSTTQLEALDDLHTKIKTGETQITGKSASTGFPTGDITSLEAMPTGLQIARLIELGISHQECPLKAQRALQEVSDNDWVITTQTLKKILGLTVRPAGKEFSRIGFQFKESDRRDEWTVAKKRRMSTDGMESN